MAKHPHRLLFINGKTWKCTLPGCSFFVHQGLAHLLLGKQAICWECGEQFTVDARSLEDEQPKCDMCRSVVPTPEALENFLNARRQSAPKAPVEPDIIEVDED